MEKDDVTPNSKWMETAPLSPFNHSSAIPSSLPGLTFTGTRAGLCWPEPPWVQTLTLPLPTPVPPWCSDWVRTLGSNRTRATLEESLLVAVRGAETKSLPILSPPILMTSFHNTVPVG